MSRHELTPISWLVLNAMSNDYEDLEVVLEQDLKCNTFRKVMCCSGDVLDSIVELIGLGLARGYEFAQPSGQPIVVDILQRSDITENRYFWVTNTGKDLCNFQPEM